DNSAAIWDMATGTREYVLASAGGAQPLPLLPSSVVLAEQRLLLVQFPDGGLNVVDGSDGWRSRPAPFVDGPCGGFCSLGDRIAVGAWGSSRASLFDSESWEKAGEIDLGGPFQALLPLGPDTVAVHHTDATVSVWRIENGGECIASLDVTGVRSIGGGLPSEQMAAAVRAKKAEDAAEEIRLLRDSFDSARDFDDIRRRMAEVMETDHGFKGLVLLADWCRRQKNPIAELHVRTTMCLDLPIVPESAMHLRMLGELRAALGEPELALEALRLAGACDPEQQGLGELIDELETSMPEAPAGDCLWQVGAQERGIGAGCDKVQELILRDLAAGREVPRRYALELKSGANLANASIESVPLADLVELLRREVSGTLDLLETPVVSEDGKEHKGAFIDHRPPGARGDGPGPISLLCELALHHGNLEYSLFVSVEPQLSAQTDAGNPAPFVGPWNAGVRQLEQRESSLHQRYERFEQAIQAAAPRLIGPRSTDGQSMPADSGDDDDDEFW
ncbi:hypothetical protein, partial [Roseovarius sp.]|uniref:hypothetical protein n=1 Tax=Roseovarius sp. TaxID=1486281 RepID=UPI003567694D